MIKPKSTNVVENRKDASSSGSISSSSSRSNASSSDEFTKPPRTSRSGESSGKRGRGYEKRPSAAIVAKAMTLLYKLNCTKGKDRADDDNENSDNYTTRTSASGFLSGSMALVNENSFCQRGMTIITVQNFRLTDNMGNEGYYRGSLLKRTMKPHGTGKMVYTSSLLRNKQRRRPTRSSRVTFTGELSEEILSSSNAVTDCSSVTTLDTESDMVCNYTGQWLNGDWSGFGTFTCESSGIIYEGGFLDNLKHGLGVIKYPDGRVYEASFLVGMMLNKGHLTWADGGKYWGSWNDESIPHGRGKKQYPDGRIYDGEFETGVINGHGRMTWPDGSWHLGEWSDGVPNGLGMHVAENCEVLHEGMFCRGEAITVSSLPSLNPKSSEKCLLYRCSITEGQSLEGPLPKNIEMRKQPLAVLAR